MLFTPGDRPDMIAKAARSGTDAVIVDLEDAVAGENKPVARANLADLPDSPVPYFVRTKAADTGMLWDDLVAAGRADIVGSSCPRPMTRRSSPARLTLEVYKAADLSAETGQVVDLPLDRGAGRERAVGRRQLSATRRPARR